MGKNGCLDWDDVIQWDGWTREFIRDCCAEIRSRVTALDVAKRYGTHVSNKGWMLCPFHNDTNASLKIYPGNNGFYCFSCHAGGDSVKLASGLLRMSTVDTIRALNDDFHVGLHLDGEPLTATEKQAVKQAAERRRQAERAAQQLEEWRMSAINRLSSEVQTANTLKGTPDTWTAEQKAALLHREQNEYLLNILTGDDVNAIIELYKGR